MARYGQIRSRFSVYPENISESTIFSGNWKTLVSGVKIHGNYHGNGCFPSSLFQAGLHERRSLGRGAKNGDKIG